MDTHTLLTETENLHSLAVAVIDEQHRFGVSQRRALRDLGGHRLVRRRPGRLVERLESPFPRVPVHRVALAQRATVRAGPGVPAAQARRTMSAAASGSRSSSGSRVPAIAANTMLMMIAAAINAAIWVLLNQTPAITATTTAQIRLLSEPTAISLINSARALAENLAVSPSTLNRIITGKSGISPDMALRLSKALGRSAESWLAMQDHYDLWQARQHIELDQVRPVDFAAA